MRILDIIAWVLLIIGGINWGLVGAFDMDLVSRIFGAGSVLSRVIFIVVGLSALYGIYYKWQCCQNDHNGSCKM